MDIILGIILYAEIFLLGFCTWRARTASKKQDVSYIIIVDFLLFAASFLQSILMYRS